MFFQEDDDVQDQGHQVDIYFNSNIQLAEDYQHYQDHNSKHNSPSKKDQDQANESGNDKNPKSLANLSIRFKQMIQQTQSLTLDLNQAADKLACQKRRLYDIVNVLQGVGYIQKIGKNMVKWVGGGSQQQMNDEIQLNDQKIAYLAGQDEDLDKQFNLLRQKIKQMESQNNKYDYILESDLKQIKQGTSHSNQAEMIVKLQQNSKITSYQDTNGTPVIVIESKQQFGVIITTNQKHQKSRNLRSRSSGNTKTPL